MQKEYDRNEEKIKNKMEKKFNLHGIQTCLLDSSSIHWVNFTD